MRITPAALLEINAQPRVTVMVVLDTFIEVDVRTSLGNRRTALQSVKMVRSRSRSGLLLRKQYASLEAQADASIAAIHSFSNLYPCPLNNGSFAVNWCCGAQEGSVQGKAGCCHGPLVPYDFGFVIAINPNPSTLAASSSQITSSPNSGAVGGAGPNPSALASTSSFIATIPSAITSPTSLNPSESAVRPTPTSVGLSSDSAPTSRKGLAVEAGVGVPVAVLLLFGLILLFLRERRRRIHAQKTTNGACTAAEEREGESQRDEDRESSTARTYESQDHRLPQELEYLPQGPGEIDSRDVHEASGGF